MTPLAIFLQGAAIASSLLGYLILAPSFMPSPEAKQLSAGSGLALLSIAATYGWWPAAMAAAAGGLRGATLALVILDVLWAVLAQGAAGVALCALPLCPDFAPWGDLVRYGSLVTGLAAAWSAWTAFRASSGTIEWRFPVTAVALVVVSFALQGTNATF